MKYAIIFSLIFILSNAVGGYVRANPTDNRPTIITANDLKNLNASHRSLEHMRDLHLYKNHRKIINIDVSHNSLESVRSNDFRGITDLEIINLSYNRIQRIGAGAFLALSKLASLDLSFNRISSFSGALFVNNNKLENLNVMGNPLTIFSFTVFSPFVSSIRVHLPTTELGELDISCRTENYRCPLTADHVSMPSLGSCKKVCSFGGFNETHYFENLTTLNASGTPFPISELLSKVTSKLQELDVSHTKLSNQILNGTLGKYQNLTKLYLSNNNLTTLDAVFGKTNKFEHLRRLDLNVNHLKHSTIREIITPTRFESLKEEKKGELKIFENDINCHECKEIMTPFEKHPCERFEKCVFETTTNAELA